MRGRDPLLMALDGEEGAPVWARAFAWWLAPAGAVYRAGMALRRRLYERGALPSRSVPAPVLSVGNLTLGGTGKTPAVAWVISRLLEAGRRPAVVSRGYRGGAAGVTVVGDGKGSVLSSPPAGDEAAMLARRFPQVPVLTGAVRSDAAERAVREFGAEVIVLDDGFQHLALRREWDLVLVRGERPWGNGRVFPAGALREPFSALRRASAILLTGEAQGEAGEKIASWAPHVPLFRAWLVPEGLLDGAGRPAGGLDALRGVRAVAVSGIARPEGFAAMLAGLGVAVAAHHAYPDHAAYGALEAGCLAESLRRAGADLLLTTEKDAVKLAPWLPGEAVRVLRVGLEIEGAGALARLALEASSAKEK
ncbi:MAG: tetraacyldisaccharide 4'-kinase [Candidatus Tectomicrobia bacterium]|nr:tetraacyldisaccharide 4'-kinase [Candidatus Tectomicrobia bacterium]